MGPIVGGFITKMFGWRWAFYINLPIGAIMIVMTAFVIRDSKDPGATRVDIPGVLTFSIFLFLTTLALISGNHDGWARPHILIEIVGALIFLGLFVAVEMRQTRPMLDFSFFRRPTYLGANIAQLAFAAGLLTMLAFMPIYFQSGLGLPPRTAGLLMLPMAVPLFVVPRIVSAQLSHRLTGRSLLTLGLAIVSLGLGWMAVVAAKLDDRAILVGMLLTGMGAGLLNGETTKVGMTVIPPERAGMASGVSGTVRFTGIVIGFAALGVVLYSRIASMIATTLPALSTENRIAYTREVVAGDLSGAGIPSAPAVDLHVLALKSFGAGYEALLFAGAGLTAVAALATWFLVRASDTPPIARTTAQSARLGPDDELPKQQRK
jgi:predicted MFS family arabinose efflux permease